ncbi:hypothetical protein ACFVU2_01815 [Leifsonia sp. NPDC058194]|uniref:hypothetical protein n=1 Tax=Leifsonia sp. NPDC058194 TaxID=3346374 RepID=UPI0036D8B21C
MFSFTTELVRGDRSPLELIEDVLASGVTDTIEVDGPQCFTSLPVFPPEEVTAFREMVDRTGVGLSMLGVYNDRFTRPGHVFTAQEGADFISGQLASAAALGFRDTRIAFPTDPEVLRLVAPSAEEHGVRLLQEVQGAATPDDLIRALEAVDRIGSDALGFVFDLSACMPALPLTYLEALRRDGVPSSLVSYLDDAWRADSLDSMRQRLAELSQDLPLAPAARTRLSMPFGRFGRTTVADWRPLLSHFDAIHLKFWDLEDDELRVSAPIADVRQEFGAIGYDGVVTSEWGGHEWFELAEHGGQEMSVGHRRLYDESVVLDQQSV